LSNGQDFGKQPDASYSAFKDLPYAWTFMSPRFSAMSEMNTTALLSNVPNRILDVLGVGIRSVVEVAAATAEPDPDTMPPYVRVGLSSKISR